MRIGVLCLAAILCATPEALAQEPPRCRILCEPEFGVEPTITVSNLFGAPRTQQADGREHKERRETEFETVLSLGLPTRVPWLEFTVETIFRPFDRESMPELELETNVVWLPEARTRGWVSSHFDVVDQFSPAERPTDTRAYTHKLDLEWDTGVAIFNWLPEDRWLRGVELEGSLDYLATGLPAKGDEIDGTRFLEKASPWSFSVVFAVPVAPF